MRRSAVSLVLQLAVAGSLAAQTQATAPATPAPAGAFVGFLKSTIESVPIRLADIRLFYIDSTKEITGPLGVKMLDTFVDTLRSRVAASDSAGFFAVWRLPAGKYLMNVRRIGFNPIEAFVTVDTETVLHDFAMEPIVALLNKVEIKETSTTSLAKRLDHVGFLNRKKFNGGEGTFITPGDIERYKPQTVRDILQRYGIYQYSADIQFDRMPLDWDDVQDYPAELIAGVEIYRHGRPVEFNSTRRGPNLLSPGGSSFAAKFLVVIWTYIP